MDRPWVCFWREWWKSSKMIDATVCKWKRLHMIFWWNFYLVCISFIRKPSCSFLGCSYPSPLSFLWHIPITLPITSWGYQMEKIYFTLYLLPLHIPATVPLHWVVLIQVKLFHSTWGAVGWYDVHSKLVRLKLG